MEIPALIWNLGRNFVFRFLKVVTGALCQTRTVLLVVSDAIDNVPATQKEHLKSSYQTYWTNIVNILAFLEQIWLQMRLTIWLSVIFFFIITKVWLSDWVLRVLVASNFDNYFSPFLTKVTAWTWVRMSVRLMWSQKKKMDSIQSKIHFF